MSFVTKGIEVARNLIVKDVQQKKAELHELNRKLKEADEGSRILSKNDRKKMQKRADDLYNDLKKSGML